MKYRLPEELSPRPKFDNVKIGQFFKGIEGTLYLKVAKDQAFHCAVNKLIFYPSPSCDAIGSVIHSGDEVRFIQE